MRKRSFLPAGIQSMRRRTPEEQLIKEAFLKGISTRQVEPVVALITDQPVSATKTVSRANAQFGWLAIAVSPAVVEQDDLG